MLTFGSLATPAALQRPQPHSAVLWRPIPRVGPLVLQELRDEFDIDVRVLGIMSSSRMLLSDSALDLSSWRHQFEQCAPPRDTLTVAVYHVKT